MATNNTKNTTTKKGPTKAELEEQIARLQAQLAAQNSVPQMTQPITFTLPVNEVTVVYCSDSLGHAAISNMELNFNKYGEEFIMARTQFDELVGKYRSWFDAGILTVSSKNVDVAAAKGLKTDAEVRLSASKLNSIGKMSSTQLEELWNSLDMPSYKESVVSFYKRKFIEGDPDFVNREKVDLLNRLTNGGFRREQDELGGRYKINPTEM